MAIENYNCLNCGYNLNEESRYSLFSRKIYFQCNKCSKVYIRKLDFGVNLMVGMLFFLILSGLMLFFSKTGNTYSNIEKYLTIFVGLANLVVGLRIEYLRDHGKIDKYCDLKEAKIKHM